MDIHWLLTRYDDDFERPAGEVEAVIEATGTIRIDGEDAGEVGLSYVYADDPESDEAFLEVWDLSAAACSVYEDIFSPGGEGFRDPLPIYLGGGASAILCLHYIALKMEFRRRGIGLEVMRETVRQFADDRTGAVLLDFSPLQHREGSYDDFIDEVRDLPSNHPEIDKERLIRHFEGWGMERLAGTRFMLVGPMLLCDEINPDWYPGLLED